MSIRNGKNFNWVYDRYLAWFHDNAKPTATPQSKEELMRFPLGNEDVFEQDAILLNQIFFAVPLRPSDSLTGQLRLFAFSELNLMAKDPQTGDCNATTSAGYTVM